MVEYNVIAHSIAFSCGKGPFYMKYFVLLCDGMADRKQDTLGGKTPMEVAKKPTMNYLALKSFNGLVCPTPEGMVPESDTANMAIMSFDPGEYSKGRSPLEALAMGIKMTDNDTAYRCNLVALSEEEENYADRIMLDHSADEITTAEAKELIAALNKGLGARGRKFHTGISYRHCLMWKNAPEAEDFARPHDILGQRIGEYLPSETYREYFEKSYEILKDHPVNVKRRERGLKAANSLWLWSPGKKPEMPSFEEKWEMKASVISAVDLIRGIAIAAGMKPVTVEGATGNIDTNYEGKAKAAINEFEEGAEFVYVHVEAPDECGHRGQVGNKVLAIEYIDSLILKPVYEYLQEKGEPYKIMVLPDHPTPVEVRTHTSEPVPFFIYNPNQREKGYAPFTEENAAKSGFLLLDGDRLLSFLIRHKINKPEATRTQEASGDENEQ